MFDASLAEGWRVLLMGLAGVAGGVANGVAGGGTFITFPTMLALGIPALQANVSSTVGVVPSYWGSVRGFRDQVAVHRDLVRFLVGPSLAGTAAGCAVLLTGSPTTFRHVVPWLIGVATVLFALSPLVTRRLAHVDHDHPARRRALAVGVFVAAAYGGYFGAGLGIILLAILAIALPHDIHEVQGVRSALSLLISSGAALVFLVRGHLAWDAVGSLLVGTALGGWLGARLIARLPPIAVRVVVVAVGAITTVRLALTA